MNRHRYEFMAALAAAALLSSLAVPAFNGYVERSRVARAVSDIGTIGLHLYRWQQNTQSLPESLAEAGLGGNDPWGRPYVYFPTASAPRNRLRKDSALAPLNTDFDLYSLGADGQSAGPIPDATSRDDIVRAKNGAYIGLAINY